MDRSTKQELAFKTSFMDSSTRISRKFPKGSGTTESETRVAVVFENVKKLIKNSEK